MIGFRGKSLGELLLGERDLSVLLEHCRQWMDVDYVAAASLLVRFQVARKAGLWDDYFIHFDDVEWCLRIASMGYRIAVSARSLIWHLSAEYKVPTWILYYDNRNMLYMVQRHGGKDAARGLRRHILRKSFDYTLLGKEDLAGLLEQAVRDFDADLKGRKNISLDSCYHDHDNIDELLMAPEVRRVLIPWTIRLDAVGIQGILVQVMKKRPELQVDYLVPPIQEDDALVRQIPGAVPVSAPRGNLRRYLWCLWRTKCYDIVFQSDYQPLLSLSRMGKKILYVNYETMSLRLPLDWKQIIYNLLYVLRD